MRPATNYGLGILLLPVLVGVWLVLRSIGPSFHLSNAHGLCGICPLTHRSYVPLIENQHEKHIDKSTDSLCCLSQLSRLLELLRVLLQFFPKNFCPKCLHTFYSVCDSSVPLMGSKGNHLLFYLRALHCFNMNSVSILQGQL